MLHYFGIPILWIYHWRSSPTISAGCHICAIRNFSISGRHLNQAERPVSFGAKPLHQEDTGLGQLGRDYSCWPVERVRGQERAGLKLGKGRMSFVLQFGTPDC